MNKEDTPIKVKYKWNNEDKYGDLVCELTEYMDNFLIDSKKESKLFCTYLYNDIGVFSKEGFLQIAFRVPGATRGSIIVRRLDSNKFRIEGVHFNVDVCFEICPCYKRDIVDAIDLYIGRVLDFSNVELLNNNIEFTYN